MAAIRVTPRAQLAASSTRFFHGVGARSVDLHPQGRLLLLASRDCVRLMRAESGETVLELAAFPAKLTAVGGFVFLGDGSRFAGFVHEEAGTTSLRVWSIDGAELTQIREPTATLGPILAAAGERVLVAASGNAVVWDLLGGTVVATVESLGRTLFAAALDPTGTRACALFGKVSPADRNRATLDHVLVENGSVIARHSEEAPWEGWMERDAVRGVFLADGSILIGAKSRLDHFAGPDLAGRTHADIPSDLILDVAASPDGLRALVTIGHQHETPAFEFRVEPTRIFAVPSLESTVLPLAGWTGTFLRDGRPIVALGNGLLRGEGVAAATDADAPRDFVAIARVGADVLVADERGGGLRLDPATLALSGETTTADADRLALARGERTADGRFVIANGPAGLAVRSSDGRVLWSDPDATAHAISPDGQTIACGQNLSIGGVHRRKIEDGTILTTCAPFSSQTNAGRLTAVAFSAEGRIGAGDADGILMLFQKDESRAFGNLHYRLRRRITSLLWHPDGKRIFVGLGGDRGTILLLGDEDAVHFVGHHGDVTALWLDADAKRLVSAGRDGQCFTWDVQK